MLVKAAGGVVVEPRQEGRPVHQYPGGMLTAWNQSQQHSRGTTEQETGGLNPGQDLVLRLLPAQGSEAAVTTWDHGVTPAGRKGRGGWWGTHHLQLVLL